LNLFELGLLLKTTGDKEAKAALQSVDQAGKSTAANLSRTEGAMSSLGNATTGTTSNLSGLGRQMVQNATQAAGFGSQVGQVAGSLSELGPIALGVGAAILGLYEMHKQLNRSTEETIAKEDALTASLAKQREAFLATTVAGARLALQEAQRSNARTPTSGGFFSNLKVGAFSLLGGANLGAAEAGEESIVLSNRRKIADDGLRQAEIALAEAIAAENTGMMKADATNIGALATLVKLGVATGEQRRQALAMLDGLRQSLNALPISDTVGRAGLAGQIKELNDALFPKLHEHVKKLGRELSALATAPKISITPSGDPNMATAQNGGIPAASSVFGPMAKVPANIIKDIGDGINETGEYSNERLIEWGKTMSAAADQIAMTIGDSIYNAFDAAFSGEGIGGIFAAFGKTILAGLGSVFKMVGEQVIAGSALMVAIKKAMETWNPVASLAAGIALVAIGGAMGGLAGHAAQRGFAGDYGGPSHFSNASDVTRLKFIDRLGNPVDDLTPARPVYIEVLGEKSAKAQRIVGNLVTGNSRRRT
jgi:hypothetical protein